MCYRVKTCGFLAERFKQAQANWSILSLAVQLNTVTGLNDYLGGLVKKELGKKIAFWYHLCVLNEWSNKLGNVISKLIGICSFFSKREVHCGQHVYFGTSLHLMHIMCYVAKKKVNAITITRFGDDWTVCLNVCLFKYIISYYFRLKTI